MSNFNSQKKKMIKDLVSDKLLVKYNYLVEFSATIKETGFPKRIKADIITVHKEIVTLADQELIKKAFLDNNTQYSDCIIKSIGFVNVE